MVIPEVWFSVQGMSTGLTFTSFVTAMFYISTGNVCLWKIFCISSIFCLTILTVMKERMDNMLTQVRGRAAILGAVFGVGLFTAIFAVQECQAFGWYLVVLSGFHWSEYMATALGNPSVLSLDSYLINHSLAYTLAASLSWLEFWIEYWLLADATQLTVTFYAGLTLCFGGEIVRKLAMCTAGPSFNHVVQDEKRPDHVLITHGVYAWMRHPSYAGWFWWSVGTQLILNNPVCLLAYAVTSWMFFRERILFEEALLIRFFGAKYTRYQKRVPTGLPAIRGYVLND